MDLYEVFRRKLFDEELVSSELKKGKYVLEHGRFFMKIRDIDTSLIDKSEYKFSPDAEEQIKAVYSKMNTMRMSWMLPSIFKDDPDIQRLLEESGLSGNFRPEEISGAIYILSPAEMFDRKEYGQLQKNGVEYLPFDLHYGLAICFKVEKEIKDNLYIFNIEDPDVIDDMKIGCQEYLRLAYEAKLFYYWQYAYLNKDGIYNQFLNTFLPEIFPFVKLNLSDFQK